VLHSMSRLLTSPTKTRLERLARNRHSSLLQKFINYGEKKFYNIGPWLYLAKEYLS
jgi:hypothetical protein